MQLITPIESSGVVLMPYKIIFRQRSSRLIEYAFCSSIIQLYAIGENILSNGGTIIEIISANSIINDRMVIEDLHQAMSSEDFYRREYARIGMDYPSMRPLRRQAAQIDSPPAPV